MDYTPVPACPFMPVSRECAAILIHGKLPNWKSNSSSRFRNSKIYWRYTKYRKSYWDKRYRNRAIKENYGENRVEQLKVTNVNKPIVKKYEEAFNIANRNRYQVQQDPHESDQDFLNRIQSLEQFPFDENIFKDSCWRI